MNYIKSEFYRTIRCRGFVIASGVIFALCAAVIILCAVMNQNYTVKVTGSAILGLVIMISGSFLYFAAMIGYLIDNGEKKEHTVKHTVAYGIAREKLYLLRFANQAVWGTAVYFLTAGLLWLLSALLLPGTDAESVNLFWKTIVTLYPLCIGTLALLHAISMNMENTNLSIVPLALILSVLPWALQIIGMRFEIMTEVARWLPSSLANYSRILEETGMVEKCWGVGIFWIAASSAVGILLYKKQEIR